MSYQSFEEHEQQNYQISQEETQHNRARHANFAQKTSKKNANDVQNSEQHSTTKNSREAYREANQEYDQDPWHAQEDIIAKYLDEQQQEEDEELWPTRYDFMEEDNTEQPNQEQTHSWMFENHNAPEEYLEDHQHEKQQKVANEQSRLASHFKFMRQFGNQYQQVVAAVQAQTQKPSRPSFVQQLWKHHQASTAAKNPPSQRLFHHNSRQWLRSQVQEIAAAVCFLSVLPFPIKLQGASASKESQDQPPQLTLGGAYFPLVGLLIALIASLCFAIGFALHFPSMVRAAVVTVALVVLTGGLHLDGLMDSCDGLFGSSKRERRLEIMRDSHMGSFGVLAGICVLLLKFAILASLDPRHLALALVIVLPLARWAMVLAIALFPSARTTGLGTWAQQTMTRPRILMAGISSLLIALLAGQLIGLAVWVVGSLAALAVSIWVTYALNGLTGDIYGAIAEITEVVCLLVLVVAH